MAKDNGLTHAIIPDASIPEPISKCIDRAFREHEANERAITKKIFTFPNTPVILLVEINGRDHRVYLSPQDQRNEEWNNLSLSTFAKYVVDCPLELTEADILWIERCNKQIH